MSSRRRTAVFTTVYPGVGRFLGEWYQTLAAQTDQDFDLWIATDGLPPATVCAAMGATPPATWVEAQPGDSPATVRQRAFARLVDACENVVFVDSDDLLMPERVAKARQQLETADVAACAMRVIDEAGRDTGLIFAAPDSEADGDWLLRRNVFGLSNTAYRCSALRQGLPIPAECVLVDWYLATRAWAAGARLTFGADCCMAYRQYGNNTARVVPPFSPEQILQSTNYVLGHYACLLRNPGQLSPARARTLVAARDHIETFHRVVTVSADVLQAYVDALNRLPPRHIWWSCVAHPQLEEIWKN